MCGRLATLLFLCDNARQQKHLRCKSKMATVARLLAPLPSYLQTQRGKYRR